MHVIKNEKNGIVSYSIVNERNAADWVFVAETSSLLKNVLMKDAGYTEEDAEGLVAEHGQKIDEGKLAFVIVHEDRDLGVSKRPQFREELTEAGHYVWGLVEEERDEDSRKWVQETMRAGKRPVTAALVIGEFRENQKAVFFLRSDEEVRPALEIVQPYPRVGGQMIRRVDLRKFDTAGQMPN